MLFRQFYEPYLAQYSYMVACPATGEAMIVDPLRDIDRYLQAAEVHRMRITHVTETHIHADFLSGARALAEATGAELLLSDEGGPDWQYAFSHTGLQDGDVFRVGNIEVRVHHTPGHTPEHLSFALSDAQAGGDPAMILTGDFVFVGDVGRPDLLELAAGEKDTSVPMARALRASLHRFRGLADDVLLWPGHGAGSACGKSLGAVPVSTVGYEKRTNWALQEEDERLFISRLLAGQPDPPRYFAKMKMWNRSGERASRPFMPPKRLSLHQLEKLLDGALIIDARHKGAFAAGHIPGSINIQNIPHFTSWVGRLLDYDSPLVLIAPESEVERLGLALYRIGVDNIAGYFADLDYWRRSGHSLTTLAQVSSATLFLQMQANQVFVVDVREQSEFEEGHLPGAVSMPGGRLPQQYPQLTTDKPVVVYCGSGDRSSIAASFLRRHGMDNVINLSDGYQGWLDAGFPTQQGTR